MPDTPRGPNDRAKKAADALAFICNELLSPEKLAKVLLFLEERAAAGNTKAKRLLDPYAKLRPRKPPEPPEPT